LRGSALLRYSEVLSGEVDVFSGSKHESDAREFDTRGITVFAQRPLESR
jgi:hypothetical protein